MKTKKRSAIDIIAHEVYGKHVKNVMNAKEDEEVYLVNHPYLESVKFEKTFSLNEYTWTGKYKKEIGTGQTWMFPMKSNTTITTFKTLIGAKKNFIRKRLK
jgi:hypothetical protein